MGNFGGIAIDTEVRILEHRRKSHQPSGGQGGTAEGAGYAESHQGESLHHGYSFGGQAMPSDGVAGAEGTLGRGARCLYAGDTLHP